jgi:thioredoxin 1
MKVIKFYADWCAPCKAYAPIFEKVMKEKDIDYENIDIDKDTSGLAAEHNIRSIPATVFIYDDGNIFKSQGALPEEKLKELIK